MENNLSETAFIVQNSEDWGLRWFTPQMEVDLCGHATLASAFVIFNRLNQGKKAIQFQTRSGLLAVEKEGEMLVLDFPSRPGVDCAMPEDLVTGLGHRPQQVLKARDYLAVFGTEEEIRALNPNIPSLARLDCLGIIATAPGKHCDFVSRFFAPRAGVDEDPVTGSAHCTLVPYWSKRLAKKNLHALQLSRRGGELFCQDKGERVRIGGQAVLYLEGKIELK